MPLSSYSSATATAPSLSSQSDCHFFRIPPELRNRVHEDLLYVPTRNSCIAIVHESETSGKPTVLRLLLTCRQVRDEAEGIFYNLNELYFNIGPTDLPNFHRFLRALSPRRRGFIKRLNLDLSTVESVAPILRLLERFTAIESLTLGFPRGHDDLREGMLSMAALKNIKVAVVGNEGRRGDPLVIAEARAMQVYLQSFVVRRHGSTGATKQSGDVTAHEDNRLPAARLNAGKMAAYRSGLPSTADNWPAQLYTNFYERFETPESDEY